MLFNILSPLIYIFYVECLKKLPQCPKSDLMRFYRKVHNISLSILSLIMLIGITIPTYSSGKFDSFHTLLCLNYEENRIATISSQLFLYSKYLEWGDTLFIYLSGKPITNLQYTHHMSTALLTYLNLMDYISPCYFIVMSMNCFVHVIMYWYFAFPRGVLFKIRKNITQIQIIQHIIVIFLAIYSLMIDNCRQNKYGSQTGLLLYIMYFSYFMSFYVKSYIRKKLNYI